MLKNKSLEYCHSDLYPVGHNELFAELNPAEASLIEGGATLCCSSINDPIGQQARLVVDGTEVWCGNPQSIDRCIDFQSSVTIELVDICLWPW